MRKLMRLHRMAAALAVSAVMIAAMGTLLPGAASADGPSEGPQAEVRQAAITEAERHLFPAPELPYPFQAVPNYPGCRTCAGDLRNLMELIFRGGNIYLTPWASSM